MIDLIAEYDRHLAEDSRAKSTRQTYLEVLRRMDRELPAGLVGSCSEELKAWIYADDHKPAYRKLLRAIACGFFDYACDPVARAGRDRLDFNPARLLPKVKVPERLSQIMPTEVVHDIIRRSDRPHRDWFVIAAYAGARCIEIAELRREDISEKRTLLHGKGSKDRFVKTHAMLWELAQQLPSGPVAAGLDRQQISHRGNYYLQQVLGHSDVHMHRLRKWFADTALGDSNDYRSVQLLLGHAHINTTMIYLGAPSRSMDAAVDGLPGVAA